MQRILVIEDDENIRTLLEIALTGYGYEVISFEAARPALDLAEREKPDLMIFDLMLPGMDGLEAISEVRKSEYLKNIPILVLTARDKEYDKVIGLDKGADDYMTKPFGVMELAARVRSLLRRAGGAASNSQEKLSMGELFIDPASREVRVNGVETALTYKEYELLVYLCRNRTRVVEREELLGELWGYGEGIETRTLDIHIRTLRQKLGTVTGARIKTVRGVGYRFVSPEEMQV